MTTERFWAKVNRRRLDKCWLWLGAVHRHGYAQFENRQAGRIAWELTIGPIAQGLEIAHICGLRRCCNPAHLALVTHLQAQLRSPISFASINAAKTRCPRGHEYDYTTGAGWRRCRACGRNRRRATNSESSPAVAGAALCPVPHLGAGRYFLRRLAPLPSIRPPGDFTCPK